MGQTVNLLVFTFGGSNPSLPTVRVPIGVANSKDDGEAAFVSRLAKDGRKAVLNEGGLKGLPLSRR